jgi:SPP1 family predicted phage head-tail adaptor
MRAYKAGDLRHPATLLEPNATMNGNRRTVTWTEHEVMAGKTDVSSREFAQALAYHAEDIVTWLVRYRTDVTSSWRLRHGGQTYEIVEVNHLGYMGDYMTLKCRRVTGGGV